MGKREYSPDEIDPRILPLVNILNEIDRIQTYSSCEGHDDERRILRTPYVSFWLIPEADEEASRFSDRALRQLSTLSWIVSRTFEDGFQELVDLDHGLQEPIACIVVVGERPGISHDEVPDLWAPVSFSLRLLDQSHIPLIVEAIRENWSRLEVVRRSTK